MSYVVYGVLAPKGTPPDVMGRLTLALNRVIESPHVQQQMKAQAMEPVHNDTPEKYTRDLAITTQVWTKLANEIGFDPEKK